ncbi:vomeronasal type-1 receptor 4-like [Tachyglossus aculeatus]|uniref:vomeronasal type-1 receptor 4-like n=1 Tax=Tachyglossus aculeatus TaxID=9261 RepID=UPI0018F58138|nr:vomeronasal type-1 receptor 4-like [Tachyglossus aculeatus]
MTCSVKKCFRFSVLPSKHQWASAAVLLLTLVKNNSLFILSVSLKVLFPACSMHAGPGTKAADVHSQHHPTTGHPCCLPKNQHRKQPLTIEKASYRPAFHPRGGKAKITHRIKHPQTPGKTGNSAMLMVYFNAFMTQPQQKKTIDLIFTHLTMVNTGTLFTRGVPEMLVAFGMKAVLNDAGCQSLMYINRVCRGLSICTTCLLSMFQAITISPSTSYWVWLKSRAPSYILPSFLFFWILNMLIYVPVIISTRSIRNVTDLGHGYFSKYCFVVHSGNMIQSVSFLCAMTVRDFVFLLLMSWASGYMVTVLYQHRKQVQHMRGASLSPRSSAETRATHIILLLASCFVCFYCISSGITLYVTHAIQRDADLESVATFFSACYPALCPLVLISSDPRITKTHCPLGKERHPSLYMNPTADRVIAKN